MDDLTELLRREYYGLPVWGWLVVAVVGVAVGLAVRRRFALGDGDDVTDPTDTSGVNPITGLSYGADPIGGFALGQDFATVPQGGAPAPDDPEPLRTNADWLEDASTSLRSRFRAVDVDTALRKYLNGQRVTSSEVTIINAALTEHGPPPGGAPPVELVRPDDDAGTSDPTDQSTEGSTGGGSSTGGSSTQRSRIRAQVRAIFDKYGLSVTSSRLDRLVREVLDGRTLADIDKSLRPFAETGGGSSSSGRKHRVVSGDTYWGLAERYYGSGTKWRTIADANPYPPRDIPIGVTLTIP